MTDSEIALLGFAGLAVYALTCWLLHRLIAAALAWHADGMDRLDRALLAELADVDPPPELIERICAALAPLPPLAPRVRDRSTP